MGRFQASPTQNAPMEYSHIQIPQRTTKWAIKAGNPTGVIFPFQRLVWGTTNLLISANDQDMRAKRHCLAQVASFFGTTRAVDAMGGSVVDGAPVPDLSHVRLILLISCCYCRVSGSVQPDSYHFACPGRCCRGPRLRFMPPTRCPNGRAIPLLGVESQRRGVLRILPAHLHTVQPLARDAQQRAQSERRCNTRQRRTRYYMPEVRTSPDRETVTLVQRFLAPNRIMQLSQAYTTMCELPDRD